MQNFATGPCPHCQVAIQAEFKTSLKPRQSYTREAILLETESQNRRFRPSTHSQNTRSKVRMHPSQI